MTITTTVTAKTPDARLREAAGVSVRTAVRNILSYWDRATPEVRAQGARWYDQASSLVRQMADEYGHTPEHIAALVSHLSPQTTWKRNVIGAREILAGGEAAYCIEYNRVNALRALGSVSPLETFSVRATKTRSFARNLLGDDHAVTIDVWAARIALGVQHRSDVEVVMRRRGVYEALAHAYRLAARRADVTPAVMQATTWIVARNGRAT